MSKPILVVASLATVCMICASCNREHGLEAPESAQFGPGVDYTKIGDCHDTPISWTNEADPKIGNKIGRVCSVSVEYLKKEGGPCNYDIGDTEDNLAADPTSGPDKPLDLNVSSGDHVYFYSKDPNRKLRVRRFVRTVADRGMKCDQNPFLHVPDPHDDFAWNANTRAPKFGAVNMPTVGCQYKFEVQVDVEDPNSPDDRRHGGKRFACYDPHIRLVGSGGP